MRHFIPALLLLGALTPAVPAASHAEEPANEEQKTLYALGLLLGRNVAALGLAPRELEWVKKGFVDSATGAKPKIDLDAYGPKIQTFASKRMENAAEQEKTRAGAFLVTASKQAGAVKLESGLIFTTVKPGTGQSPKVSDRVKVHYHGTLIDGTVFDSSVKRGEPAEFGLGEVIRCWTEGLQRMKVGEKAKLVCPSSIGYGDQGRPPTIPGGATLVFEVELIEIKHADTPTPSHGP